MNTSNNIHIRAYKSIFDKLLIQIYISKLLLFIKGNNSI